MTRRVLVVQPPDPELEKSLPGAFRANASELAVDISETTAGLVERLRDGGFDAVICWAERPEELELVVRIRAASPDLPILLITKDTDEALQKRALQNGVTGFIPQSRTLSTFVSLIEQSVQLRASARETRAMSKQGREFSREVRQLARETRALSESALRRLERPFKAVPIPLLISNDPEQAFQMVKAFEKAEMFAPLPILRSSEEAIAYLSGAEPYQSRERYPLPTLVILDFHGAGMSGLEVLGWIRQNDRLRQLPVIMMSGTLDSKDLRGGYGLQANSYLIKPGNFDELVEMVRAINLYWSSLNISPET